MRSKRILVFLIPVFIISLIYGYLRMPKQERVIAGNNKINKQTQVKNKESKQKVDVVKNEGFPRLKNNLIERQSQPYPGVHRDLFSSTFLGVQQGEGTSPALPADSLEEIVPPVTVPEAPPPPSPQEIARQELSLYKFVGFFKKGEKKTIFLSNNGEIFLVRKGDYLGQDRKYYVLNLTDTTLELRKEGVGDFLIKLTDQESLSAVSLNAGPSLDTATPDRDTQEQEQEINHQDQPELLPTPDEESQTEDQLQPEEDK